MSAPFWSLTEEDAEKIAKQHAKMIADKRKERKRHVRNAVKYGGTVPYDLRTLIEDGHSLATVQKVYRGAS